MTSYSAFTYGTPVESLVRTDSLVETRSHRRDPVSVVILYVGSYQHLYAVKYVRTTDLQNVLGRSESLRVQDPKLKYHNDPFQVSGSWGVESRSQPRDVRTRFINGSHLRNLGRSVVFDVSYFRVLDPPRPPPLYFTSDTLRRPSFTRTMETEGLPFDSGLGSSLPLRVLRRSL